MNKLPLIVGGFDPLPTNREPQSISWAGHHVGGNPAAYLVPSASPDFTYDIPYTEIYLWVPPRLPIMQLLVDGSQQNADFGRWVLDVDIPHTSGARRMHFPHITDFANIDRRGRSNKVFEFAFASAHDFEEIELFRYSLDAAGTKFIAATIWPENSSYSGRIVQCLDGVTIHQSAVFNYGYIHPYRFTGNFRFIFAADRVEVHTSQPNMLVIVVPFVGRVRPTAGATLDLLRENAWTVRDPVTNWLAFDKIAMYDIN